MSELKVGAGDWIVGKTLDEAGLVREGLLVLGMECPGNRFIGAPDTDTEVRAGDLLVLYGRTPRIAELDCRGADHRGDEMHRAAVDEHEQVQGDERRQAER